MLKPSENWILHIFLNHTARFILSTSEEKRSEMIRDDQR